MTKDEDTNALVTKAEINRLTEREAANESLVKRIRLDCGLVFKKTHEKQYCLNEEIRGKISSAANSFNSLPPAVEQKRR